MSLCKLRRLRRVNISIPRDTSDIGREARRPGRLVSPRKACAASRIERLADHRRSAQPSQSSPRHGDLLLIPGRL